MGIPIGRLQDEISSADFALYQAFNNIDPFENYRFDINSAVVSQVLAQVHGSKRTKLSDFIPQWDKPPNKTARQLQTVMNAFAARANGK